MTPKRIYCKLKHYRFSCEQRWCQFAVYPIMVFIGLFNFFSQYKQISISPSPSVGLFYSWTWTDGSHICVTLWECWLTHQDEYQVSLRTYGNYHNLSLCQSSHRSVDPFNRVLCPPKNTFHNFIRCLMLLSQIMCYLHAVSLKRSI